MAGKNITSLDVHTTKKNQIVDITSEVRSVVRASGVSEGICIAYVPHTTAAVTINENADPDVKSDFLKGMEEMVPDGLDYRHAEGNSPAHIKASITGSSVNIIVSGGQLGLGTWQGIYFCEFDGPRSRRVYVKVIDG